MKCPTATHLGKSVKVDVLISYQTTFSQIHKKERPFLQYQRLRHFLQKKHKSPCTMLQATENKAARGNHRKQVLSTPASEVRVPGRLEVEHSLSWTCWCWKGKFSVRTSCLPREGKHFFPQFVISVLYTTPSRKPKLRYLRESREICCSS